MQQFRPILIIGDSNIARLPRISDDRIQTDCYPGANLSHATNLLRHNTPRSNSVTKVILSFGLNNKNQENTSLLKKDLHAMLVAAINTFPQAVILIPLIHYSQDLPENIKANIKVLNHLIEDTGHQIPRIKKESFFTERDNIHWTPQTARNI